MNLSRSGLMAAGQVPEWFVEMMATYPVAGITIGVPDLDLDSEEEDELGKMFELGDGGLIKELNTDSYPGMYLFQHGYLSIGLGAEEGGHVLVLSWIPMVLLFMKFGMMFPTIL